METTLALPSLRLEQRMKSLSDLSENDHYLVAEKAGQVVGLAGLTVGTGRLRHSGHVFVYVAAANQGQGIGTRLMQTLLDLADQFPAHRGMLRYVQNVPANETGLSAQWDTDSSGFNFGMRADARRSQPSSRPRKRLVTSTTPRPMSTEVWSRAELCGARTSAS